MNPSPRKKAAPFLVNPEAELSLAAVLAAEAASIAAVAVQAAAVVVAPVRRGAAALSFSADRPKYAVCASTLALENLACGAIKKKKKDKTAAIYDCNALGLRADGSFPMYAIADKWPAVTDARVAALMIESKRKGVRNDFSFNALGRNSNDETFFKYCTNYERQNKFFRHDEVTLIDVDAYAVADDPKYFLTDLKDDVAFLRGKLNYSSDDDDHDATVLQTKYAKYAKKANKRAKNGDDLGIYLTVGGFIARPEEDSD